MFPVYDPICVLLERPFSQWHANDKKDFLKCDKPTPALHSNAFAKIKRKFKNAWYCDYLWLCGSFYLNKLFCIFCVTYSVKSCTFNRSGFHDLANATRAFHRHEGSSEHIRCALIFTNGVKNAKVLNENNSKLFVKQYNEQVLLNRRLMKLPVLTVLYLGKRELTYQGYRDDVHSPNGGNFKQLLDSFVSVSPPDLQSHYKKIKNDLNNSKSLQNEIINCLTLHIDEFIDREINESLFFAIQVNDCTELVQTSQCSLVIRFVSTDGKLVERFLGFYYVDGNRTAEALCSLVTKCLDKYDYKSKLVAQYFDGSCVPPGELNDLQAKIKSTAPQATFTCSASHYFNDVLQQCCQQIPTCRAFFASVTCLCTFLHRCVKRPDVSDANILAVVNKEWYSLRQMFTDVMNDSNSDQSAIWQSENFSRKFGDFDFAFLAIVFNEIFDLTRVLSIVLQRRTFDVEFCQTKVIHTQAFLTSKRSTEEVTKFFNLASLRVPFSAGKNRENHFETCKILYFEILDTILEQIAIRFQDVHKLHFIALLDSTRFVSYATKFPLDTVKNLKMTYSSLFPDYQRLVNELQLIYNGEQYRHLKQDEFTDFLTENSGIFKETYKLFCLVFTLPSTVGVSAGFSCVKRTREFLRYNNGVNLSLAKISIEKDLLIHLENTEEHFYEDIIDKYAKTNGERINLLYKKHVDDKINIERIKRDMNKRINERELRVNLPSKKFKPSNCGGDVDDDDDDENEDEDDNDDEENERVEFEFHDVTAADLIMDFKAEPEEIPE